MDAARALSEEPDLRRGLCVAARLVLGGDTGTLWEPRADGLLENTGTTAAMAPIGGMLVPLSRRTVAGLAVREDRRVFVHDTEDSEDVAPEIVQPVGLKSVLA
jgi:hypothetical protein